MAVAHTAPGPMMAWQDLFVPATPSSPATRPGLGTGRWPLPGAPLLCLHKTLDPKLVAAIEYDVVPALQELGIADAGEPDLDTEDPS